MKIVIQIDGFKPEHEKEIKNSIKGFAKSLAKRFGFQFQTEIETSRAFKKQNVDIMDEFRKGPWLV